MNPLYGGVLRKFEDVDAGLLDEPAFRSIWDTFVSATGGLSSPHGPRPGLSCVARANEAEHRCSGIDPTKEIVFVHQAR